MVPLVRVPTNAIPLHRPLPDAGMMGIMVPMVETAAQARDIVA